MTVGDDVQEKDEIFFSPFSSGKVRVSFNASRSLSCFIISVKTKGRGKKKKKKK